MTKSASDPQARRGGVRLWWPVAYLALHYAFTRDAAFQGLEGVIEIDDQPVLSRTITERDSTITCIFVYGNGTTRQVSLRLAEEPAQPGQAVEEL